MNRNDLITVTEARRALGLGSAEMSKLLSRGELALYSAPGLRAGVIRNDVEQLRLQPDSKSDTSK